MVVEELNLKIFAGAAQPLHIAGLRSIQPVFVNPARMMLWISKQLVKKKKKNKKNWTKHPGQTDQFNTLQTVQTNAELDFLKGSCWSPSGSAACSTPCPSWPPTCRRTQEAPEKKSNLENWKGWFLSIVSLSKNRDEQTW